ncbi:MAG: growth inhibitor PemK [Candidatus Riflebacteria bacterium RBG_13_59_9]|nr:MAG: growth inhibitor PemK [Candidatus Riflebacteria bacterium RBG_13_59_9]
MPARGEIYFVELRPAKGREQRGTRPVLVVSSDAINTKPLVITVVVGTSGENVPVDYPSNVRVSATESGLAKETVFYCFQLRSLDPSRFPRAPAGRLSRDKMVEVDRALKLCLDL